VEVVASAEAVSQWRLRKAEEKKLRDRKSYIEAALLEMH
jgi:hypothetical protein